MSQELFAPLENLRRSVRLGRNVNQAAATYVEALDADYYHKKDPFSEYQDVVIKMFFNRCPVEEITEYLGCSMNQFISRAQMLGVCNHEALTAHDMLSIENCFKAGHSVEDIESATGISMPDEQVTVNEFQRKSLQELSRTKPIINEQQGEMFNEQAG